METTQISIFGYKIGEKLYDGSRTLVYRGTRESDEKPVVIKLLKNYYPSFSELVQFRNQYTIAKNLDYRGIIQTYSLENYQNGYALVMEDMGGISLNEYFTNVEKLYLNSQYISSHNIAFLQEFLQIAIYLCDILDFLCRHRVIHKDIKPANLLINPATKQVKIIDFGIASLLPKETQKLINPNILEGTLNYISPEQTGRMNRGIDYRTDFYSLGVTFYELLTGELPFKSDDAMELVHFHIAKMPCPITNSLDFKGKEIQQINKADSNPIDVKGNQQINKPHPNPLLIKERGQEIPQVLSDIVMKLMAKNAEDRYQSALGLKHDLETCLEQLVETGKIEYFPIAQKDIYDRFIIPEKLYGRETEVKQLLAAFDRVADVDSALVDIINDKKTELMLVAGFSGIGKTALVREVHKPIVKQRGYFIKGKFDQFNRNIPLSAFVQAFRDLMTQLFSESDAQLLSWKNRILQALGVQGQVIIDVIPELEKIIGKQLSVTQLSGTAAQNRFNLLFQKFIQVFTTKEHPLVIFLDDLQWADTASLKLVQLLMSDSSSGYLLLIGAYRDNEVFPAHPLMIMLDDVDKAGGTVNTITLQPLSQSSLNQLVADTLNSSVELAQPLTQLVYQKTKGNAFFSTQFLKSLHEEGLINFDLDTGYWQCDFTKIKQTALTDDVVEFMALQLQKFPEETRNILKLAACIGNEFDLTTLEIVCEKSPVEIASNLWKVLQEGLILPQNEVYKFYLRTKKHSSLENNLNDNINNAKYRFLHDRVQQAAYSLISDDQKQALHYHIGQLLLLHIPSEVREERIFELVNQLNYGTDLITLQSEREQLAQLNLIACRKAKNATAYQASREYANIGLSLLGENAWLNQYEMTLAFHDLAAELASLCKELVQMEKFVATVIEKADNLTDKINVYRIKILSKVSQNELTQAISIALQLLEQLGVNFPQAPTPEDIQQAMTEIALLIGDREITDLIDSPIMTDKQIIATVQIANSIVPAAYISGSPLFPLLAALPVKLSIQHGNTAASATAYVCYGIIACNLKQDVDTGAKFGQLALDVAEKLDARTDKPAVFSVGGLFVFHRKSHTQNTLPILREGYTVALEVGNLEYVGYAAHHLCLNSFWCAQTLDILEQEARQYYHALVQCNQLSSANYCLIYWQTVLNLLGVTEHPTILSGKAFIEAEFLSQLIEMQDFLGLYLFNLYKLMLCYLFGEIESAQHHVCEIKKYFMAGAGNVGEPAFYFYDSLINLAAKNPGWEQTVEQNQTRLQQQWANYAPMNHQHKYDLVEAEKYRVKGEKIAAIELYDKAIAGAKRNSYIQEEALANELAAKFYLEWDKEILAQPYMQQAYYCYAKWGAKAKIDNLEKHYHQLLRPILFAQKHNFSISDIHFQRSQTIQTTDSSSSISQTLDFTSILKATQALSSEIKLEELISTLLQIVIENAGAEKAAFIFLKNDILSLEAIATKGDRISNLSIPYEKSADIPIKVINYVKRCLETVVLDNVTVENYFTFDEYLIEQQPYSLLCKPILDRGKLTGLLYLENKLTIGAFTPERLEVVNLLCSQAAISLGNARLYKNLEQSETKFRAFVENLDDLIYSVDLNGNFTYLSPQFTEICGYEVHEFINKPFAPLVHPEDLQNIVLANQQIFETGTKYSGIEFRNLHKNGSWIWLTCNNSPIKNADGKVIGLRGIARNITDKKLAEAAITEKSQQLEQTLQDLQQAQLQMVQNEKMATLGNLVAGVAHEVNNPIGFLKGSISNAEEYIQDLLAHIECYQENYPTPEEEVIESAKEIELEFLTEDLPKLLDSMKVATERITDISTSLRTFSRADTSEKVACNIHEGIDSTILILKYRLKANDKRPAIEVIKEYGQLALVKCFLGQLNQVFMNIIANAIDALDMTNKGKTFAEIKANPHKITINTELLTENNLVIIKIKDNGPGMPLTVRERIFDNLFTTKGVGKGTGLGLAIAKQIVEETHGGKISCNSTVGKGTEFIIELPIK